MQNGANSVHKQLRTELEDYIKSQYFGKSPILLSALSEHIDDEGLLYQKPFIESSPACTAVRRVYRRTAATVFNSSRCGKNETGPRL